MKNKNKVTYFNSEKDMWAAIKVKHIEQTAKHYFVNPDRVAEKVNQTKGA